MTSCQRFLKTLCSHEFGDIKIIQGEIIEMEALLYAEVICMIIRYKDRRISFQTLLQSVSRLRWRQRYAMCLPFLRHSCFLTALKIFSSVTTVTSYRKDGQGSSSCRGKIFLFFMVSRPDLKPIQPTIRWVTGALSLGIKRQGGVAEHPSISNAEVKEGRDTSSLPYTSPWQRV